MELAYIIGMMTNNKPETNVTARFVSRCLAHRAKEAAEALGMTFEIVEGTTYVINGKPMNPGQAAALLGIPVVQH